ncbi:MAG: TRAP transporter substrate-binding protein [Clostridia bacterium]|nr:TRAP transporter substrate-binding protein [Clostridia bacterium]
MKKCLCLILAAIMVMSLSAFACAETTYRLGHMSPLDNNYNLLAERFKALVEEKSEGRIKIEIYPQAQLGYDREAMQFGTVDFAVNTTSVISNFAPLIGTLDLPYLFDDWDHIIRFIESDSAAQLLSEGENVGLSGLALMGRGFRSVTNNVRPITSLDDIRGVKIRVVESTVYLRTFEDFGAIASAMSFGEVFTALQQGAIDGQENPPETIYAERVYEVQEYLSLTQHIAGWAALMASQATMDSMSAEDQALIRECAVEAAAAETQVNREKEADFIALLEDMGMTVNDLDRAPFKAVATSAYTWFEENYGDAGMAYVNAIDAQR